MLYRHFFFITKFLLLSSFSCLLMVNEVYTADNNLPTSTGLFIILDEKKQKKNPFVFEMFTFVSGYDYQAEINSFSQSSSSSVNAAGLSVINHFGVGLSAGLKFGKPKTWYHSGHLIFEFSGTTFDFGRTMPNLLLSFRNYHFAYKHRFHFLTKVNYLLPLVGVSTSFILQTSTVDNLINLTSETYRLDFKFAGTLEVGFSYQLFTTWIELNYGKISTTFGGAFYIGFKI